MAKQIQAVTDITSDDMHLWRRDGWLRLPPIDPRGGKARRYGLATLIEAALLKHMVAHRIPHAMAADMVTKRLDVTLRSADYYADDPDRDLSDFVADPGPWLEGSEFDPQAEPFLDSGDRKLFKGRAFWTFPDAASLHDRYLSDVEQWPKRFKRWEAREDKGPEYKPFSPEETLRNRVVDAICEGSTVIEIREPLRKAFAFIYGSTFWPGRFPAAKVIETAPAVPVKGIEPTESDDDTEGGWTGDDK